MFGRLSKLSHTAGAKLWHRCAVKKSNAGAYEVGQIGMREQASRSTTGSDEYGIESILLPRPGKRTTSVAPSGAAWDIESISRPGAAPFDGTTYRAKPECPAMTSGGNSRRIMATCSEIHES
jgi:hypothetical protein